MSATTHRQAEFAACSRHAARGWPRRACTAADVLVAERRAGDAAMHLQRPDGGDDDGAGRRRPADAALDVEELLAAQIGAEAGLGDHDVGQLQRRAGSPCSELQPCAMLANGPPCTSAGEPSSVCTRLGCSASRSSAAMAPSRLELARGDLRAVAPLRRRSSGRAAPAGRRGRGPGRTPPSPRRRR